MGYPKALLPFSGAFFLTAILDKLTETGFGMPVIVLGRDADRIRRIVPGDRTRVAINGNPDRGQSSSIQAGIECTETGTEGALIWPVDLPVVPARVAAVVASRFLETRALITVPVFEGKRGHPVLFHRQLFSELLKLGPGEPARTVVQRHYDSVESVECGESSILTDIDTPEEYFKLTGKTIAEALEHQSHKNARTSKSNTDPFSCA